MPDLHTSIGQLVLIRKGGSSRPPFCFKLNVKVFGSYNLFSYICKVIKTKDNENNQYELVKWYDL